MALNNVPLPGQTLLQTRDPINQNFSDIDTTFTINHGAYNDPNAGKHTTVTFPQLGASPAVPGATEINLFQKALGGTPQVYVQRNSGAEIPFTAGTLVGALGSTGYSALASGILLKWGSGSAAPNGVAAVVFDATIPFTQVYVVLVSPLNFGGAGTATFSVSAITNIGCSLVYGGSGPNPITMHYVAIGRGV